MDHGNCDNGRLPIMAGDLPNYDPVTNLPLYSSTDLPMYGADCSPCDDCTGTQPSATVSFDACTPTSTLDSGVFTYTAYEDRGDGTCFWRWSKNSTEIEVEWNSGGSNIVKVFGSGDSYEGGGSLPACIGGILTGTVDLYDPVNDCYGSVTFG